MINNLIVYFIRNFYVYYYIFVKRYVMNEFLDVRERKKKEIEI